jgi:hypothetical protein
MVDVGAGAAGVGVDVEEDVAETVVTSNALTQTQSPLE